MSSSSPMPEVLKLGLVIDKLGIFKLSKTSPIEVNSVKQVYPPSSLALNPKFFTNPNKPS